MKIHADELGKGHEREALFVWNLAFSYH